MTMVLSLATHDYVLQVGDRLVVVPQDGRDPTPHDSLANKQLVFLCADAVVAVGYAGRAYLNELPTDHRIAESLSGLELPWLDGHLGMRFASRPPVNFAPAIDRLIEELGGALEVEPGQPLLNIDAFGWFAGQSKPLVCNLRYARGSWDRRLGVADHAASSASSLPSAAIRRLQRVHDRLHDGDLESGIAQAWLIDQVRRRSTESKSVGPDCMAILLPKPDDQPTARIEYVPREPSLVALSNGLSTSVMPGAFSPWVITPSVIVPPQAMVGQPFQLVSELTVEIVGPVGTADFSASSSQRRTRPPY